MQKSFNRLKFDNENQPRTCILSVLDIHLLVLSTYFHNWQLYLTVLNNEFEDIVSTNLHFETAALVVCVFCAYVYLQAQMVLTIQWNDPRDFEDGQERLQRLHYLQDRVFGVSPRLRALLDILGTLDALKSVTLHMEEKSSSGSAEYRQRFFFELREYEVSTAGLLESARSLERRMEGILKMVSSNSRSIESRFLDWEANLPSTVQLLAALSLRHQATGVDISGSVVTKSLTLKVAGDHESAEN